MNIRNWKQTFLLMPCQRTKRELNVQPKEAFPSKKIALWTCVSIFFRQKDKVKAGRLYVKSLH